MTTPSAPTEAQRHQLLVEWNDTAADYPRDRTIHQLFEEQARLAPDATAVVFGDDRLTYSELNARANQLARHLDALGVGPEQAVGICLDRGIEMVVGLLAILKAGGAYLPMDPGHPVERLAFMLEDAGAPVLLTQGHLRDGLRDLPAERVRLDADWSAVAHRPDGNLSCRSGPGSLAYVTYTSGSTGVPKGVMVEHRSVVALVCNQDYCRLTPGDVVGQASSISFDALTFELWAPLVAGACVAGVDKEALLSSEGVRSGIRRHGITVQFLTTAVIHAIAATDPTVLDGLHTLLFGGEVCDPGAVRRLRDVAAVDRVVHVYGPTETTTFATWQVIGRDDLLHGSVPIGRPIANAQVYVLGDDLEPVPPGVQGELYIGGAGVARGYLRRPELTAERFVPNPFGSTPGDRLYRTGDLGRHLTDGSIEFAGRGDHQVKIRGFRVELGEVESALAQHPGVREAVVVARQDSAPERRLVAYLVPSAEAPSTTEMRTFLGRQLPDYSIPSAFVTLEALPLSLNGKVDRDALPAPTGRPRLDASYVSPRTPTEQALCALWAEVLGVERVGVNDNFFELGGDSLTVVRLCDRVSKVLGRGLSAVAVFRAPTVGALAHFLDELAHETTSSGRRALGWAAARLRRGVPGTARTTRQAP